MKGTKDTKESAFLKELDMYLAAKAMLPVTLNLLRKIVVMKDTINQQDIL